MRSDSSLDATSALPTREQTIAWLVANFESRLWRTANDDYQLRLLSRYEVEAVKSVLSSAVSEIGEPVDRDAIIEECAIKGRIAQLERRLVDVVIRKLKSPATQATVEANPPYAKADGANEPAVAGPLHGPEDSYNGGHGPLYDDAEPAQSDLPPCTCHPDDNPPVPCPRKYALTECREAARSASVASEQEPCAWRWKQSDGPWRYGDHAPTHSDAFQIEPLYPLPWARSASVPIGWRLVPEIVTDEIRREVERWAANRPHLYVQEMWNDVLAVVSSDSGRAP